jgi:tetratricopeptide (TPR) repeat protein
MPDVTEYLQALAAAREYTDSGRWPAAATMWERVTGLNPVHGDNWDQLANARSELGDHHGALEAYRRVQATGVAPSLNERETMYPAVVAYRIATCHAALGEHEDAVRELARAVDLGLRNLEWPRDDKHWKPLLEDGRVRDLLGLVDTESMTREQGWQVDLDFLAREIGRRAYAYAPVRDVVDAAIRELSGNVTHLSDLQVLAGIMRVLRTLGDGHAFAVPAEQDKQAQRSLPVKFYSFAEGVFVTAVARPIHRQLLGSRLTAVGGKRCDEVLAAVEPLISRDNDQQVVWLGPELLRWTPLLHALGLVDDPARAVLTVTMPDGTVQDVTVEAEYSGPRDYPTIAPPPSLTRPRPAGWISLPDTLPAPLPSYLRNCDVLYWFEYLRASGVVYFQFNGVGDQTPESLEPFCERLFTFIEGHDVSKLVIDLRWNGGGNTYLVQPLLHRLIGCAKVNQPGCLYVIIGRGTFSAAQNTATAIERETSAIFVGEPSGSRPNFIGETIPFTLPYSKTKVNVADLYWQTAWPMDHRPWIAPQLYAPPTFEAFSQNRDPALEAIASCTEHLPGF